MSATYAPGPAAPSITGIRARISAISDWFLRPSVLIRIVVYLTAAIYLRTVFFDYVYDDNSLIIVNPWMASWKSVPTIFTHSFWSFADAPRGVDYYRPLVMLVLVTVYRLLGPAPGWFHLVAASIHVLATYLTYRLAVETTSDQRLAAISAGIFGLHPTKVETAAWISGISDSLSVVFFLASMIGYFRWKKTGMRSAKPFGFSLLMLLFAFFSKEAAIFAPVLIAIYEFSVSKTEFPNRCHATLLAVWPYATVTALALSVRLLIVPIATGHLVNTVPVLPAIFTAPKTLLWYVSKQVWPTELSIQYSELAVRRFSILEFLLPLAVVSASLVFIGRAVRKSAIGVYYFAWFLLMLAPVLIYQIQLQQHDRYFYLASVASSIGAAYLLSHLGSLSRVPQAVAVVAVFGMMTVLTIHYESYWDNDLALFTRAFAVAPDNANAARYLAGVYIAGNQADKAEAMGHQMINSVKGRAVGWYILGVVDLTRHNYEEAHLEMQNSLQFAEENKLLPSVALANIDVLLNRKDEAVRIYREQLQQYPNMAVLKTGLASALQDGATLTNKVNYLQDPTAPKSSLKDKR